MMEHRLVRLGGGLFDEILIFLQYSFQPNEFGTFSTFEGEVLTYELKFNDRKRQTEFIDEFDKNRYAHYDDRYKYCVAILRNIIDNHQNEFKDIA